MSDFSKKYYAAQELARMDMYMPEYSSSLRDMEEFAQPRLDYATSRMRAILKTMLADPEGFTGNPEFMEMLGDEVVRCSVFLPCCAQRLKSIPVAMVGDLTIKGAVLRFHPLFQGFVKCTSVVRGRFIEISSRLAKEVLTPQDGNDATAAVEEYMYDWWKFKTQYTHIQQFEDAFQFHVGKVGRSNLHLIPC